MSSMALQAAPGDKTMRVYSTRMETLFIRLDINGRSIGCLGSAGSTCLEPCA